MRFRLRWTTLDGQAADKTMGLPSEIEATDEGEAREAGLRLLTADRRAKFNVSATPIEQTQTAAH